MKMSIYQQKVYSVLTKDQSGGFISFKSYIYILVWLIQFKYPSFQAATDFHSCQYTMKINFKQNLTWPGQHHYIYFKMFCQSYSNLVQ